MAKSRFYLAYGSNLSVEQMLRRCPDAVYVGTADLNNMRLNFRGSKTGSYLTVDPVKGETVPCLVWKVSDRDEAKLDIYEGYPKFYRKVNTKVDLYDLADGDLIRSIPAFYYRMDARKTIGIPSKYYLQVCFEGYKRFGFDLDVLDAAYDRAINRLKEAEYAVQW